MNILFLCLRKITDIDQLGIYPELMKEFVDQGHHIYCVSCVERRERATTAVFHSRGSDFLTVRTLNIQKTNLIEKGIATLLITGQFKRAVKKYFGSVKFDLILYPTPPITLTGVVNYFKKRDSAFAYLMLKDIFPQNAVDLGMMSASGISGILYRYFRRKERRLYSISDKIGCMSKANIAYLLSHNPGLEAKSELCPNSVSPRNMNITDEKRRKLRRKYQLPLDKKIFVYGGNLGKPQGIPFLIDCIRASKELRDAFFLVVGDGTEYGKLQHFLDNEHPDNFRLMKRLPREDFELMNAACDVGLIFLDHRFTIPNFPSRLLSYMQAEVPVIACTDPNTDVGEVITEGGFGWWAESDDPSKFVEKVKDALESDCSAMGKLGRAYLEKNYTSSEVFQIIMRSFLSARSAEN